MTRVGDQEKRTKAQHALHVALDLRQSIMDFDGQKNAEFLFQIIIALFGLVGWIVGFVMKDFLYTVIAVGLGTIIALVSCLPDWPVYNKMNLKWQKPKPPPVDPAAAKNGKAKAK